MSSNVSSTDQPDRMDRNSNNQALHDLKSIFANQGVRGAVEFLNSLTPHRFTSLFRFDGEILRNITFFDRENPDQTTCDEIPVTASYCVFVRDSGALFSTHNAQKDDRVLGHAKRETVQCYCGVPLLDRDGWMFGTICHFDLNPGRISRMDVELLEHMAGMLQRKEGVTGRGCLQRLLFTTERVENTAWERECRKGGDIVVAGSGRQEKPRPQRRRAEADG